MTSSLPEPEDAATAHLWARRSRGVPAIPYAAALIGGEVGSMLDAVSISLASSREASVLLDGMELRIRTLPTSVETAAERCVFSVRGPILWSETITARANALGNEDVFVCATSSRSFDTVENRELVGALDSIARAGRALLGPVGAKVLGSEAQRISSVAAEAASWRAHPRLAGVRGGRLSARERARLRNGHRSARMAPVLAVRARVAEPFVADDLVGLADSWTRSYHEFVRRVLRVIEGPDGTSGFSVSAGGLWSGPLSWRHPQSEGDTPAGLCYRGVPLLAPERLIADAPWFAEVPTDGVRIVDDEDIVRLLDRLGVRPGRRRSVGSARR